MQSTGSVEQTYHLQFFFKTKLNPINKTGSIRFGNLKWTSLTGKPKVFNLLSSHDKTLREQNMLHPDSKIVYKSAYKTTLISFDKILYLLKQSLWKITSKVDSDLNFFSETHQ